MSEVLTEPIPTSPLPPPGDAPGPLPRTVWVQGDHTFDTLTDKVSGITEMKPPKWWWPAFLVSLSGVGCLAFAVTYLISTGIGVWGLNSPVGWAFDITNFVFWVGIGHAGTLISAILLLLRQKWRMSINRFAEAMTLFAVACAGIFPAVHVGRVWYAWYLAPIPNYNDIWPNFRSPLLWDVFAISTYATVSLLFWYTGLIPDLATLRDRSKGRFRKFMYGIFALGWRGSGRHWHHYETACLILAGISTPLVVSVHTIVSADFATSNVPGWHATIFPPYFVAGAIFSGFAMVLTLMILLRQAYNLKDLITERHLEVMCKVILATGTMVGFAYATEFFTAWYGGDEAEQFCFVNRAFGPYWWAYWIMVSCNVISPQLFWFKRCRTNPWIIFVISIMVNVGMWFERFVIIVTSLHRDRLPSAWGMFYPTWVDVLQMVGAFGLFFTLVLLFIRILPMFALSEVKGLLPAANPHHGHGAGHTHAADGQAIDDGIPVPVPNNPGVVLACFHGPGDLLSAAQKVREAGYTKFDTHSPFAIHGMDKALGLKRSILPWIVLIGGITGCAVGGLGMLWINTIDYKLIVGGKPYGALEPLIPITFEVTVLFSAFATVGGLLWLCGLPKYYHAAYRSDDFERVTAGGFVLTIDAKDPKYDATETPALLKRLGGSRVAILEA